MGRMLAAAGIARVRDLIGTIHDGREPRPAPGPRGAAVTPGR
jgi:hypothetical protein